MAVIGSGSPPVETPAGIGDIDADGKGTREINQEIRERIASGFERIRVVHPTGKHNLAVGLTADVSIEFEGPVGYFIGGMMDGPRLHVAGNCGWSAGEDMLSGEIVVDGYAGNSIAPAIRGGAVVIRGNAGARTGVSMKGGLLIIGGSVGYMSGFMMQKGTFVVCGDAGPAIGDSMYEGTIFVGGSAEQPGNDAVVSEIEAEDEALLSDALARYDVPNPGTFKKITSGRRLWNFSKKEIGVWIEAL